MAIAIWFVLASHSANAQSAETQEMQIPDFVLTQVLGAVPPASPEVSITPGDSAGFGEEDPDLEASDAERRRVELQIMRPGGHLF